MKNLIITMCDKNYSHILNSVVHTYQDYATKIGADLSILYGGYPYVDRYYAMLRASSFYDNIAYLDCDMYIHKAAPNIFDLPYKDLAFRLTGPTEYRNKIFESVSETLPYMDENYYVFGGLAVGRSDAIRTLAYETICLWEETDKGDNKFLMNDEVYLCQVLKRLYPDFHRLDEKWIKTMVKTTKGEDFYFSHAFGPAEKKVELISTLKGLLFDER